MSKIRLIMLSMLIALAVSAIASASAAAANGCEEIGGEKCQWTLNGKALGAPSEIRTLARQWNSTQTLKGTVGGLATTIVSKLVELKGAEIEGGTPGLGQGKIVFTNVEVLKPAGCQVNKKTVETEQLKSRLVEFVKGGTGQKKDLLLFEPPPKGDFVQLTWENLGKNTCPITAGTTANVDGNVQAEFTSHAEGPSHTLKTQGKEVWEYRPKSEAAAKTSGLTLAGNAASFEGTTNAILTDKVNWGTN